jgi:hypothetical protein
LRASNADASYIFAHGIAAEVLVKLTADVHRMAAEMAKIDQGGAAGSRSISRICNNQRGIGSERIPLL